MQVLDVTRLNANELPGMLRDSPCIGCGYRSWTLDFDVEEGYCSVCATRWRRQRLNGRLAMVTSSIPWDGFLRTRVMEFMEGSMGMEEIARHRRTRARYMTLSTIRCDFRILRDTVDKTDRWTSYVWRRDLLQLVLSFLERHWIPGEVPAYQ